MRGRSSLRGRTPAGTPGQTSVTVTNPDGKSSTLAGAFRYLEAPAPDAGTPDAGTPGGDAGTPDAGTDGGNEPEPAGCGCTGTNGGFTMFALFGLAALLRSRRSGSRSLIAK